MKKRNLLQIAFVMILLSALYAPVIAQAPQIPVRTPVKIALEARFVPLNAGWNLVGYTGRNAPIEIALSSVAGKYDMVYGYDAWDEDDPWRKLDLTAPDFLRSLWTLERGRGYWVHCTERCALELP